MNESDSGQKPAPDHSDSETAAQSLTEPSESNLPSQCDQTNKPSESIAGDVFGYLILAFPLSGVVATLLSDDPPAQNALFWWRLIVGFCLALIWILGFLGIPLLAMKGEFSQENKDGNPSEMGPIQGSMVFLIFFFLVGAGILWILPGHWRGDIAVVRMLMALIVLLILPIDALIILVSLRVLLFSKETDRKRLLEEFKEVLIGVGVAMGAICFYFVVCPFQWSARVSLFTDFLLFWAAMGRLVHSYVGG